VIPLGNWRQITEKEQLFPDLFYHWYMGHSREQVTLVHEDRLTMLQMLQYSKVY